MTEVAKVSEVDNSALAFKESNLANDEDVAEGDVDDPKWI